MDKIVLNQIGYLPKAEKKAVFRGECSDKEFEVVDALNNSVVFTGKISEKGHSASSGENVCTGDFSEVTEAGEYYIRSESCGSSFPFKIGGNVFDRLLRDSVRMMYFQRCGTELDEKYAGKFSHKPCHMHKAYLYGTDESIDVSGGWHDAGDYGRYTVAAAVTAAQLLLAYEKAPSLFTDDTGIPESGNGVPDILDEVKYCLDWLFKMQTPDGGVYHKVTCADFPGYVMPEEETDRLIICPVSKTASADLAAVMAMAYESFKDIYPDHALKCLAAAERAWTFLENGGGTIITENPPGIVTGAYGDDSCDDELYWAAAQLYKATGREKYRSYFEKAAHENVFAGFGWRNVGHFGNIAYLSLDDEMKDPSVSEMISKAVIKEAEHYISCAASDGYGSALEHYWWGSNMQIMSCGMTLMLAYRLTEDPLYYNAAAEQLNYLLGKNPLGMCFVTGHGTRSPHDPHHRLSAAMGEAVKGMVVGGADEELEDPVVKEKCKAAFPAMCYIDDHNSYSTNETDTYWNSLLTLLLVWIY
ncbi:MAG: glycoside hydrolase family 9 protein [Huintestinicola sp.]|uniref:glycoside hydrolase family 9 protein n=1 Tax=Huintestinicola sp. TaxID=2981661 RepID=UPI003F0B6B35